MTEKTTYTEIEEKTHTDRKKMKNFVEIEMDLEDCRKRLKKIVENSHVGYFLIDMKGFFQNVNNSWLRIHGYSSLNEVVGRHISSFHIKDEQNIARDIIDKCLSCKPFYEAMRINKDGSTGYHMVSAVPVYSKGKMVGVEGFINDVTDHRSIKEQLVFQSRLLSIVRESIIATDLNGKVNYWSQSAETLYGYKSEEILGYDLTVLCTGTAL